MTSIPPVPTPPAGFDPDAGEFQNVSPERFTQVPKSSHRRGEHRLASLLGLGVLTLYLSNKSGWKIPNAAELAAEWNEGAVLIRKAVADLERAGFLVRFRRQTDGGRWKTVTVVSADPKSLDEIRAYAVALTAHQEAAAAARKAAGRSGSGRAGQVAKPAAVEVATSSDAEFPQLGPDVQNRDPVQGDPVRRDSVQGHLKDQETREETLEETKNPPPSSVITSPPRETRAAGGEFDEATRAALSAAVQHAVAVRAPSSDWSGERVVAAIEKHIADGHGPLEVAAAMIKAADGDRTHPGGVGYLLAQAKAPSAQEPSWAVGPVRYVDPDVPMCRTHRGEPLDACGKCKMEAYKDPADLQTKTGPAMDARSAIALARAAAEKSKTPRVAPRRAQTVDQPTQGAAPARFGDLLGAAAGRPA